MRNEIKIRFEEPRYAVNSKKGTVDCMLKYYVFYPSSLIGTFFDIEDICLYVKGTAKVSSGDVFDENVGKKISLAKAEKKAYTKIRKRLIKRMTNKIDNAIRIANNFINKAHDVIEHNGKYLEQWS